MYFRLSDVRIVLVAMVCTLTAMAQLPARASADSRWLVEPEARSVALADGEHKDRVVLENGFVRVVIDAAAGGRAVSFVHKQTGCELTRQRTETQTGGLLADGIWQQNYSRSEFNDQPWTIDARTENEDGSRSVTISREASIWKGVKLAKTITLSPNASRLRIDYKMIGGPTAHLRTMPDFWFHQAVAAGEGDVRVFMPSPVGVIERPSVGEDESSLFEPTDGWIAALREDGVGLAASMDYAKLRFLRTEDRGMPSIEWVLQKHELGPGKSFETSATLAPISGLQRVDAVGDWAAVSLEANRDKSGKLSVKLDVASFIDSEASFDLWLLRPDDLERLNTAGDGLWGVPFHIEAKPIKADAVTTFAGDLKMAGGKAGPEDGSYVLVGRLNGGDDSQKTIRIEQPIVFGKADALYARLPESIREIESPDYASWRRYNPKDLSFTSLAYETPHKKWAKPYAAGRPRVLVVLPLYGERQAVELAQRFDLDLTSGFMTKDRYYVLGDRVRSLTQEEIDAHMDDVLSRDYDVILTSYYGGWDVMPAEQRAILLKKVEQGTGLIFTARGNATPELENIVPLKFLGYDRARGNWVPDLEAKNPIVMGIPFEVMPATKSSNGSELRSASGGGDLEDLLDPSVDTKNLNLTGPAPEALVRVSGHGRHPIVAIGQHGQGRLVQMTTGQPLITQALKLTEQKPYAYWEYQYAMIGRLLYWAAKMPPPVTIKRTVTTPSELRISTASESARQAAVSVEYRNGFGLLVASQVEDVSISKGNSAITLETPEAARGKALLADVVMRDEHGKTLAWCAASFTRLGGKIQSITLDKIAYDRSESPVVTVTIDGDIPAGSKVTAQLVDGDGRVMAETSANAEESTELTLPLSRMTKAGFIVRATLTDASQTFDESQVQGLMRVPRPTDRLLMYFWGSAAQHMPPHMIEDQLRQLQKQGMNADFATRSLLTVQDALHRLGMSFSVPGQGMAGNGLSPEAGEKAGDDWGMGSAAALEARLITGKERGQEYANHDAAIYSMGDENRGPGRDEGFGKGTLKEFRKWLKVHHYKSLSDLNAKWRTEFSSWDGVMPMTEAQVKTHGKNSGSYAAWMDHRTFIKWAYARLAKYSTDGLIAGDPRAIVGASGTQNTSAYGGRDWWHLARSYNALSAYGGVQELEHISFNPSLIRRQWAGYSKPNPIDRAQLWSILGGNNIGIGIFSDRCHINPDYSLSEVGRDLRMNVLELMRGPGQLVSEARLTNDGIYILQSPMSIQGAHITGVLSTNAASRSGAEQLLTSLGVGFRAISYEQLADGYLREANAKVLILPHSIAMSAGEVAAVRTFVEAGGTVIADLQPAVMDEHGELRSEGALDELLGVGEEVDRKLVRSALPDENDPDADFLPNPEAFIDYEAATPDADAVKGSLVQPAVVRNVGKSRTVYLGFDAFAGYAAARAKVDEPEMVSQVSQFMDSIAATIQAAGVTLPIDIRIASAAEDADPVRAPMWSIQFKQAGDQRYLVMLTDYARATKRMQDEIDLVRFDADAHVYDLLNRAYLGFGRSIEINQSNYALRAFAMLPYRVEGVHAEFTSGGSIKPGETAMLNANVLAGDIEVGLHYLRVDVIKPDASVHRALSQIVKAPSGEIAIDLPFALNDPEGEWQIVVTDVTSNLQRRLTMKLTK